MRFSGHGAPCVVDVSDCRDAGEPETFPAAALRHNGGMAEDRSAPNDSRDEPRSRFRRRRCRATSAAGGWRRRRTGAGCRSSTSPGRRTGCAGFWIFVLVLLAINWLSVLLFQPGSEPRVTVPFSPYFLDQVEAGKVKSIASKGDTIEGTFTAKVTLSGRRQEGDADDAVRDPGADVLERRPAEQPAAGQGRRGQRQVHGAAHVAARRAAARLRPDAADRRAVRAARAPRAGRRRGGLGALGNFGRSQARRVDPEKIRVTFDDVAGIDEAKAELTEIVDFLKTPERYQRLGGRMPHGVLLSGPPGTGKTLLARAVAGEAHAAFFSISASEFIEAIVGVGASRVRDLFAKAKEAAPAIIFIDELDAIGRSRQGSAAVTGANDEREQTLDQILTEMDGFEQQRGGRRARRDQPPRDPRPGAAAARALRPARRRAAPRPRRAARRSSRSTRARSRSPTTSISTRWPRPRRGWSAPTWPTSPTRPRCWPRGASHDKVEMADFTDSLEKILLGSPRGIVLTPADRERTAYHESGHALVGMLTAGRRPGAQGLDHPARDGARRHAVDARRRPRVLLARGARGEDQGRARRARRRGGRLRHDHHRRRVRHPAAHPDRPPDGRALGDERQARARSPCCPPTARGRCCPAPARPRRRPSGSSTRRSRRWSTTRHAEVTRLLTEHRDQLDDLAQALLEAETLDAPDAYAAAGVPMRARRSPNPSPSRPEARGGQSATALSSSAVASAASTPCASCAASRSRSR